MEYYSLNRYLRDTFGTKVYKLALNAGFTCPNRDGTLDTRGCIFCSGNGSGDFSESPLLSVTEQIEEGKKRVASKIGENGKYIAYFQAFTNTYAPVETLRKLFMEAINHPDITALSVATRPDCLGEDVLNLLDELNHIKPVWVELGLQTIHEKTAEYIRRCYPLSVYDKAVKDLKERNITVIVHVILGLPFETKDEMLETVDYACKSGIDGIKLQLLHVLEGTDLAKDFKEGKFKCLERDEYVSLVVECLKIIPQNVVIHRMTGDGDKKILLAPEWSKEKKTVLNALTKAIREA
ncbi:MAG: TIGR01212 family radical SAM protein [Lachnospiraceae bacterium]|nr:TIGR01212 family radical SAM protein [Lachnospiraceae bacterium]